jgi:hypothetical protein
MRLKALIFASVLATGTAFAGQDSTVHGSVETSPPELLGNESFIVMDDSYGLQSETEVIYLYPIEVTEYYVVIPNESSEMPG